MSDDLGTMPGEQGGHRCEYPECTSWDTLACVMDNDDDNPSWFCPEHAFAMGHCFICGQFWGGVDNFEFGPGYCEHCASEIERDDYDPDDDDEYCEDDFFFPEYEP